MWTPRKVLEHYERGNLTEGEKFHLLSQAVTDRNGARFVASLAREQLRELKAYLDSCPTTDEGWAELRSFHIKSWARAPSAEVLEAARAEELRQHRRGVDILRDVVGPHLFGEVDVDPSLPAWEAGTIPKL